MKTKILLGAAILLLAACDPYTRPLKFPVVPPELADCTFHQLNNTVHEIIVVRCPNSTVSTSYRQGDVTHSTVTTSGETK